MRGASARCRPQLSVAPALAALLLLACGAAAGRILPQHQLQPKPFADLYGNYTFNTSRDTFDLCHEQGGFRKGQREVTLEELLPHFGLPADLTRSKAVSLAALLDMTAAAAPSATLVVAPMLHGDADLASSLSEGLPKLVHFTVRDKDVLVPHQVVSIASWAVKNPGYSIMLWDDVDISAFMKAYYPRLLDTFTGLGSQVERTDMWRYLVLCTFGGVYADSDVVCAKPVDQWDQAGAGLLVGIENVFTSLEAAKKRTYTRMMQMVQWTMAAKRGHPVVCRMGDYVKQHVAEEAQGVFVDQDRDHAILERTGPGIWSSSVHNFLIESGAAIEGTVAGALVRDMRVLPQTVLGCASSSFNPADPTPYVYHMFKGSWRHEKPSGLRLFLHRLAPSWFPLPPEDKHHHNEKGRGGGGAPASAVGQQQRDGVRPAEGKQQQVQGASAKQQHQWLYGGGDQPSLGLGAIPIFAVLLLVAAALGIVLHSSSAKGSRRGSGHSSLPWLCGKTASSLEEQLLVSSLPPRPGPKDASRSSSPMSRQREGGHQVACATGNVAAPQPPHLQPGRHSHKRSWGSLAGLGPMQQL